MSLERRIAVARGDASPDLVLRGSHAEPFMLSFLTLPVIPALKLTDLGLVDVARFELVPLWTTD